MRYKNASALIALILFTVLILSAFSGCSAKADEPAYLLGTQWDQTGLYAKYCPGNERAGCWSAALAQILYYHRLSPSGRVEYETSAGNTINEALDSYTFDWSLFAEKLDELTPSSSIDQVAKYIYFTSVAVEKDFGTGDYVSIFDENYDKTPYLNIDKLISNLNTCYGCAAKGYHFSRGDLEKKRDAIEELITGEIDAKRPMMLYTQGNSGHATVIDGYCYEDGRFIVHINQGTGGYGNKWYGFYEPIADGIDDMEHRIIITVTPPSGSTLKKTANSKEPGFLLKTQWDIEGEYSQRCPGGVSAGDWPAALAQVLAYHKLQPAGEVSYTAPSGLAVSEKLDVSFDWELFGERLDAKSSPESAKQVAAYIYYAALALEKDFGASGYNTITRGMSGIDVSKALENIGKYYGCHAEASLYAGQNIAQSKSALKMLVRSEIDGKRPLLFYYAPYFGESICTVIDGYTETGGRCFVHINFGKEGYGDGWYEFPGRFGETKYLLLMTIK